MVLRAQNPDGGHFLGQVDQQVCKLFCNRIFKVEGFCLFKPSFDNPYFLSDPIIRNARNFYRLC
jgi:hypothetical protein